MSMNDLAATIASMSDTPGVRMRQGTIVSVQADTTATVTIAGSTTNVAGVKVASHVCPIPGATCWLATDGRDWMVLATLAPAGPAYGYMRKNSSQSFPDSAWTNMTWGSITDTTATGVTLGSDGIAVIVPGLYAVSVGVQLGGTFTSGMIYTRLLKNGTTIASGSGMKFPDTSTYAMRATASATFKCVAGDKINAEVFQSTGAAKGQDLGAGLNFISAVWVGPAA